MKTALAALPLAALLIAASDAPKKAAIMDVVAHPEKFDGRQLKLRGLVVYEFENYGLYASRADYCAHHRSIYVEWDHVPGVTRADTRRMAVITGRLVLRGVGDPINISNAQNGPGPLRDTALVKWDSEPMAPCPTGR
ncbi:MAG: hypothetical protein JWO25_679 [Alphaproteobacteria bacterium]|nr:hypothetical protein [Alphaproteobacteria bacterium]